MTSAAARLVPGVALCVALAAAGFLLAVPVSRVVPLDATFLALALGLLVGALARRPAAFEAGALVSLKRALTWGVVLLGSEVQLAFLLAAGARGLAVAAFAIAFTLATFFVVGRMLRVPGDAWALLGAGTGICGLSAVVATGASLESREEDIAVAVAGVGLLSAVGLLLYPLLGLALRMPLDVYGAWSGMTVHAVANAVAAGFALGPEAGRLATVTKLTRVALLAPTLVALTFLMRRGRVAKGGAPLLPPMVWGFLAVALVVTVVPWPGAVVDALRLGAKAFLVLGMAALGYTTRLGDFRRVGARGIGLAVAGWIMMAAVLLPLVLWAFG